MMSRRILKAAALTAITIGLFANCAKKEEPPTFTAIYQKALSTRCVECHKPGSNAGSIGFDFTTQALAYQTMINAVATGPETANDCPNVRVINPGNAQASLLWGVFQGESLTNFGGVTGCTPGNHTATAALTEEEATLIVNWINQGAKND